MKFSILVVMFATTVYVVAADLPETDVTKNEEKQNLLHTSDVKRDDNLTFDFSGGLSSIIAPFSHSANRKKRSKAWRKKLKRWRRGSFSKAVAKLGILKIPGLKLIKLPNSWIHALEKVKSHVMDRVRIKAVARTKKRSLYDLCQEHVDSMYVLAHSDERLAYQVQTVYCQGICYSSALRIVLGQCVLKKKTMVVYVIDQSNNLVPKTVQAGCACECLTNFLK